MRKGRRPRLRGRYVALKPRLPPKRPRALAVGIAEQNPNFVTP